MMATCMNVETEDGWCKKIRVGVPKYILDPRNMVDVVLFLVETAGLAALISWEDLEWQRGRLATWSIVKWFRVMYSLRGFELFGPRMLPILNAVKDTAAWAENKEYK